VPADSYQHRLVEAILRIPGSASRQVRDDYVSYLAGDMGIDPGLVPRSDDQEADVAGLVAWCARQKAGVTRLVNAISAVEEGSAAVDRLLMLESIRRPTRVLEPQEREVIERVVAELDQSSVLALVRDIAARWGPRLDTAKTDPHEMISLLEDSVARADEPHPLHVFLARLAQRIDTDDLTTLVGRVGARARWDDWSVTPPAAAGPHYFVVRLADDGRDASRYLLAVWLVDGDGRWFARFTSDEPRTIEQVRAEVDEQLGRLADDPAVDIGDLSIEFILPRSLLGADVDQWIVNAPGYASPLGVHFPVAVRDLNRMRNRIIRNRWRRRSAWLRAHGGTAGGTRFEAVNRHDRGLFAELMQDPEKPACLVVVGQAAKHVASNISAWLSAGIPVIVWCRADELSHRFDTHLVAILGNSGIAYLPVAVWRLRQDSGRISAGADHVGRHITLMWDDAERLPPDERPLRHPANVI
jgi:hypothetical protein